MSEYESNTTMAQIADTLRAAKSVLLTTHAKPDADAYGSVTALARALELLGKRTERWFMGPVPRVMSTLDGRCPACKVFDKVGDPLPQFEPDALVITDTGAWSQLAPLRAWIEPRLGKTIVIDHHLHGDVDPAKRYVDPAAPSSASLAAGLIDALGCKWDSTIRDAIYAGLATDTGWFRFSNTTPDSLHMAARLIEEGVDHAALFHAVEMSERPEKLGLMARALSSLEMIAGGRAAVMTLRQKDFAETGTGREETERLVDLPQVVGSVNLVTLLTEENASRVRLSFRSKPGKGAVDTNALARRFGGGGHARAAGAKVDGTMEQVRPKVIEAVRDAVNQHQG